MGNRALKFFAIVISLYGLISCRSHSGAAAPGLNKNSAPSDILQADQFYRQRDDLTRLQQGIVLLRQAATNDPASYEAYWQLSKFDYYLASHTGGDHRDRAFREGIQAGQTAIELHPDRPEGHFWLGANYGGALESHIFGLASLQDVRKEMETVLNLNEGYMVLGLLDLKAPWIAGGNSQRAVSELEKGLQFGKGNAFLRLHLAEAYQAVGRAADAREQLNAILSMQPDPDYLPELKEAQQSAQQRLAELR
jgi:tetratricopeptide (TPR) repeat protein